MRVPVLAVALAVALCGCEMEPGPPKRTTNDDVLGYLPADGEIEGLSLSAAPKRLSPEQLGQHLADEAPLFLAYGVDHLATARYENARSSAEPEQRFVQADVFRMRDATAAFGAYAYHSHVLEAPAQQPSIGAAARLGALSGHLWKADCYVRVETGDRSADGRAVMRRVLEHVTRHIAGDSPRPTVLDAVPRTIPGDRRPRLFTDKVTLGNICWLSDHDVLALDGAQAHGVVIDTVLNAIFFVALYPSTPAVDKAWASYRKFLDAHDAAEHGPLVVAKLADGTYTAAFKRGTYLAGVWNARDASAAAAIATKGLQHIETLLPEDDAAPATDEAP